MTHPAPTLFDPAAAPAFMPGAKVWVVVDEDVLPGRVVRCYVAPPGPLEGERVIVQWPEAERCNYDTFRWLVFAEKDWKAARAKADE